MVSGLNWTVLTFGLESLLILNADLIVGLITSGVSISSWTGCFVTSGIGCGGCLTTSVVITVFSGSFIMVSILKSTVSLFSSSTFWDSTFASVGSKDESSDC